MKKERLDKILVDLGHFENKSKASAAILAGDVKINGEVITKSGFQIMPDKKLDVEIKSMPYVSRGGFKLEKSLKTFNIKVKDRICFDAGASTGGFSDCLLQNGAKKVYAVDVGYGQLAWKIRCDERVKVIEKTNIKNCEFKDIYGENDEIADLLVMDLSFISIEKVLPNLKKFLTPDFHEIICLIKPQFEAGKDLVEKGGVVRDKSVHINVIEKIIEFVRMLNYTEPLSKPDLKQESRLGFPTQQQENINALKAARYYKVLDLTFSPIKGPSGNIEYLIYLATEGNPEKFTVQETVNKAFNTFQTNPNLTAL